MQPGFDQDFSPPSDEIPTAPVGGQNAGLCHLTVSPKSAAVHGYRVPTGRTLQSVIRAADASLKRRGLNMTRRDFGRIDIQRDKTKRHHATHGFHKEVEPGDVYDGPTMTAKN